MDYTYDTIISHILPNGNIYFFDVFARNNELIMICPYLMPEWENKYKNMKLFINNEVINLNREYNQSEHERIYIRIYKLPLENNELFSLTIVEDSLNINLEYYLIHYNFDKKYNLVSTTLFKDDYKLINLWYNYYNTMGVEQYYMYYNGKLNNDIIKCYNKNNINLLEWDFIYWKEMGEHVAQSAQINHAMYKYGKPLCKYMISNDLDEYFYIPNQRIVDMISFDHIDTYVFENKWCETIDTIGTGETLNTLPNSIKMFNQSFKYPNRSKCIYKIDKFNLLRVHSSDESSNISFHENHKILHFCTWTRPDRKINGSYTFLTIEKNT